MSDQELDPSSQALLSDQSQPSDVPTQMQPAQEQPQPFNDLSPETKTALLQQHLDNEAGSLANDFALGHIKPKTYNDLYNEKTTPGKIMTIFGLLAGGAGSGLTHQPNALLQMMDNQIQRDLEGQQKTNENARNWYQQGLAHAKQQVELPQIMSQTRLNDAQAKMMGTNTAVTGKKLDLLQRMQDATNNLPPGPAKESGQNIIDNTIKPALLNSIKNSNAQTATGIVQSQTPQDLSMPVQKNQPDLGIDWDKFQKLQNMGAASGSLDIPTKVGESMTAAEAERAKSEAAQVMQNRTLYNTWTNVFKQLDQSALAGQLNPPNREALITPLADQMGKQLGLGSDAAYKLADSLFPSVKDWGQTRQDKWKQVQEHFKFNEASTPTLEEHGLKKPFPMPALGNEKKKSDDPNEQKALEWAKANPNDPRSAQILQKIKGGQ